MSENKGEARWKIFLIRVVIAVVCAVLLVRLFLPNAGAGAILSASILLVFFAYVFESLRV